MKVVQRLPGECTKAELFGPQHLHPSELWMIVTTQAP